MIPSRPVVPALCCLLGLGFGVVALPRPPSACGQCRSPDRGCESAVPRSVAEASARVKEEGLGPFVRGALPLVTAGPQTGSSSGQASWSHRGGMAFVVKPLKLIDHAAEDFLSESCCGFVTLLGLLLPSSFWLLRFFMYTYGWTPPFSLFFFSVVIRASRI